MNFFPGKSEDFVNDLIFGRWKSRVLYTGVRLGIFDALRDGGLKSSEICRALVLDARNGYRLMRALASIGLLAESCAEGEASALASHFSLTEAGQCLCSDHPSNLRQVALLQDSPEHTAIWKQLPEMVRGGWQNGFRREFGATAFEYADVHPEYAEVFDRAMASYSAQQSAAAVEALCDFDFSGYKHVCDIGGGRGKLVEALVQAHPHLRGTVLERPGVIRQAGAEPGATPCPGTWSYQPGDMFHCVPAADVYLLKLILHDWDDGECVRILENIRRAALDSGRTQARLLILEFVITGPELPHFSKLYDIHMMCWGDGRERSLPEHKHLLERACWEYHRFREMRSVEMGIIEARLAAG